MKYKLTVAAVKSNEKIRRTVGSRVGMLSESIYSTSENDDLAIASPFYHSKIIDTINRRTRERKEITREIRNIQSHNSSTAPDSS